MHSTKHWSPGDGVKVRRVARSAADGWNVYAATAEAGICPGCGKRSRRRHGWRHRRLQDYPAHGEAVFIELRIARWRCLSQDCSRSTFSDQAPTVAAPHARRTLRSAQIASHLGHATGGRPAERLMRRFGIPVSDDTILRQLKRDAAVNAAPARVIGLDDWSWKKTSRYGTIVVDLERHAVIDVLEDRSVASAANWLKNNPSVEVVSRDRCGLYAQAV
jgi:transposase